MILMYCWGREVRAKAERSYFENLRNNAVLRQTGSSGGGEKWAHSEYILEGELTGVTTLQ